ncbi:WD40-repeat-containing domain protein [Mycena latifolia]|nr:WD40-repeat-containing domain protein [Mycena latifolia]
MPALPVVPRATTTILETHSDQVWILDWSHDGNSLASASKDKSVIIWSMVPATEAPIREWEKRHVLNHQDPVLALAWSLDDTILLTGAGADGYIKMWDTTARECMRTMEGHLEPVTALSWLSDDSGFLSAGMDFNIFKWASFLCSSTHTIALMLRHQNMDGQREIWGVLPVRITSMVVSPDFTRLVAIGMRATLPPEGEEHRLLVYDFVSRQNESSILFEGELTNLCISHNSQYALISCAPDDILLWDLNRGRMERKYTGQRQTTDIIRSCFGGFESSFVASGSEDGKVYVWNRHTGVLLEVLAGHGAGSVNCVAWNPRSERMFASCADDRTIRIWEAPL